MVKFDVLVIGELNVDLILNDIAQHPVVGKEILAQQMNLVLGSSSAIFASNLSALGSKVSFIGKVGRDDFGHFSIECLKQKNVDTSNVYFDEKNGTGITVVMNYENDRAMVTYQGSMKSFSLNDIDLNILSQAKHMHFSSYFLQPGIAKDLAILFRKAKEAGLTVSFDPQWDPDEKWDIDLKKVLPFVDVFLPNNFEFLALTGMNDINTAMLGLKEYAHIIAVKAGTEGSYVYHNNQISHCPAFLNKEVVDAIGAGDSFNAGFIYKFVNGSSIEKCQEYANLMGAVSTTASGGTAAFQNKETIEEIAKSRFNFKE